MILIPSIISDLGFLRFIISRSFFINLGILLTLIVIVYWGTMKALDIYTKKDESITVPDLRDFTMDQVDELLQNKRMSYVIADSSIYKTGKPPLTILDQAPKPYAKVKPNRTIYLSVNAKHPPLVKLPDLIDASLEQAEMILSMIDLKIGELIYRPDLGKNVVLEHQIGGMTVEPGTLVFKGDEIDLVLGDGLGSSEVDIPNLFGLTIEEAKTVLIEYYLNLGVPIFDNTIIDTPSALIFKQIPPADQGFSLRLGEAIDVWLTKKLPEVEKDTTKTIEVQ